MSVKSVNQMRLELAVYLDSLTITSDNIGELRARLMMPWNSSWNSLVRDETAARERPSKPRAPAMCEHRWQVCRACWQDLYDGLKILEDMTAVISRPAVYEQETGTIHMHPQTASSFGDAIVLLRKALGQV